MKKSIKQMQEEVKKNEDIRKVINLIRKIDYGSVTVKKHQGEISLIEKKETIKT